MSLAESLENAAEALPGDADQIRPANGDPFQLLELLDEPASIRVLGWLLAHHPEAGGELASAWLEEEEGAALVVAVPEQELPKEGRKALRRLVHQARSRGVEVTENATAEPRVGRLPDLDEKISLAHVSPYDPRGGRLVYIVESSPSGGARVFEALLDVGRGIVDFQVYRAGRRQVGDFVRDLTRRSRFPAVEANPESVRELIRRRLESQSSDQPLPKAFSEWRGKLDLAGDKRLTPGEEVRRELGSNLEAASTEALVAEVAQGKIGPWPPPSEALESMAVSLHDEFATSEGDEAGLAGRVGEEVQRLYIGGETARANAERFDETAYIFWRSGESGLAQACLETADRLRGDDHQPIPVVTELMVGVESALKQDLARRLGWTDEAASSESGEAEDS